MIFDPTSTELPHPHPIRVLSSKTRRRIWNAGHRNLIRTSQRWAPSEIAIAGSYLKINTGDESLAHACATACQNLKVKHAIQPATYLARWPAMKKLLMGGGAVGYPDVFHAAMTRYPDPSKVAAVGVDFHPDTFNGSLLPYLRNMAWVSCRSAEQAAYFEERSGRKVPFHPDLVFSLMQPGLYRTNRNEHPGRITGINVMPILAKETGRSFVPVRSFEGNPNDLGKDSIQIYLRYQQLVKKFCSAALEKGHKIIHIPFSKEDDWYARALLQGFPVEFTPFSCNFNQVIRRLFRCDHFFSTRFHSLVFALMTQTPCIPFQYVYKNTQLLHAMGIHEYDGISSEGLLHDFDKTMSQTIETTELVCPVGQIQKLRQASLSALQSAIAAIRH
jgi:polysaccharide pyruvyl transferase WcaK-like protein